MPGGAALPAVRGADWLPVATSIAPNAAPEGPGGCTAVAPPSAAPEVAGSGTALARLLHDRRRRSRLTHVELVPARRGRSTYWPDWVPPLVIDRLVLAGVEAPWTHQVEAAELAVAGRSVIVATGTASGKSLAYLLPVLSMLEAGQRATALYLAPTKALAADQLRAVQALGLGDVRPASYDGDTPPAERDWVRAHANLVLTNPDMLHRVLLPGHARWAAYLRRLRYVVVDECHAYRGVFGSHVAQVLRRLRRICARYGAAPTFLLASATVADPAQSAGRLVGGPVAAVTDDGSPRGATDFALWEPPPLEGGGENEAPLRRSATAEAAELLADLVADGTRTLAFLRSRRGAEAVALSARRVLAEADPELADRVAAYRAGYLPEERRALESRLQSGELLGLAATSALELGVDVAGLDAVVLAGFPGRVASVWQQAGRAGRAGQHALAVLVAQDDPLDSYLVHHPDALFGRPVEATVLDPDNPHVLAPHLCAAAAELPLTEAEVSRFGPAAPAVLAGLVDQGLLRRRPAGWFWTRRERASDLADLRGIGGSPVRIVEAATGRLLGTVDAAAAHSTVHVGAVYLHQGEPYLVRSLDLTDRVALVDPDDPDYFTTTRERTEISIVETLRGQSHRYAGLSFGTVDVTTQVVGYLRRRLLTGEVLAEVALDLPRRELRTRAVWWTAAAALLARAQLEPAAVPGAAHAAEHAAIGLLPLFATCDRWDIGGVSTAMHRDTGAATVFVHDGSPGGAGFAERGYAAGPAWLRATLGAISACGCEAGCPSCVQSPKCGTGNSPLDKAGAARLLEALLGELDQ